MVEPPIGTNSACADTQVLQRFWVGMTKVYGSQNHCFVCAICKYVLYSHMYRDYIPVTGHLKYTRSMPKKKHQKKLTAPLL